MLEGQMDWTAQLYEQLDWHWRNQLRPRLDGLSDDEYLWEPVKGCWSIRLREEATTSGAGGVGDYIVEFEPGDPKPAPVTTIAWRIAHLVAGVFGGRAASHFGAEPIDYFSVQWSPRATDGLEMLDRTYEAWSSGVVSLSRQDLDRPCGPAEGPFAEYPMAALVLHINREAIHHGAEIALLRDLYAHRDNEKRG